MPLRAGHARIDITPPLGIEMAGFHKPVGQERRIAAIRDATELRALVLEVDGEMLAIVSIDLCALSLAFTQAVQQQAEARTGIPAAHVQVTATHTHSMPTFIPFRQWGAVDADYRDRVVASAVEAVVQAKADLAEADAYLGKATVTGGNFNRTAKTWKTNAEFGPDSSDAERWLDTDLHVLQFQREEARGNIAWYHFCAHPVCHADDQAGADWPGVVAQRLESAVGVRPAFLQGHIGDVNPGDGTPWQGDLEETASAVASALYHASTHAELIELGALRVASAQVKLPFDYGRLQAELALYRAHPEQCTKDTWVDAAFAQAWFESAQHWKQDTPALEAPVTAVSLGSLGLLFHPGELYSCYGLALRRDAPFATTLCIGYTGTFVGYLPDPVAYEKNEYAAIAVPKILDLPPFTPAVGREFTAQCTALLRSLA
ncbi:MAG: neutral/alkaline non-lysosomal ceramidase N-terminal domain-containing protein [Candidatus Hydrogenedentes bacterium]|nr:neutral/alkaline non-lysosomal ceramidase N-terminal domain-containing protein [Candidatus Hydrogenedentota bacterium]